MKILLFDIDGTLISSGGAGSLAFFRALQQEFDLQEIKGQVPFSGRTDRAILRDLFLLHELEDNDAHWNRFLAAYLAQLPQTLVERAGHVLPGIEPLLDQLAARDDVCLGLLTGNNRQGAELKLRHYRLADYFVGGGFGDLHYDRDDVARSASNAVMEHLSANSPQETWVIGDTPHDVTCARAIDAQVIAVATGSHSLDELAACQPDMLLEDLADVPAVLRIWSD